MNSPSSSQSVSSLKDATDHLHSYSINALTTQRVITHQTTYGGTHLIFETGALATQAQGAVRIVWGDTVLLCTVCVKSFGATTQNTESLLSVHYLERFSAAGRFPGGFVKREGKPSEREILTARLIDRSIRPLIDKHMAAEIQVICTVLSYDAQYDPALISLCGVSAALRQAGIAVPSVAATRLCAMDTCVFSVMHKSAPITLNLAASEDICSQSSLDVLVASTCEGVVMIEAQPNECSDADVVKAIVYGHQNNQNLLGTIDAFCHKIHALQHEKGMIAPTYQRLHNPLNNAEHSAMAIEIASIATQALKKNIGLVMSAERSAHFHEGLEASLAILTRDPVAQTPHAITSAHVVEYFTRSYAQAMRQRIEDKQQRIDGRGYEDVRPIAITIGLLPKTHGSALFTRGATQVLASCTMSNVSDAQTIDDITGNRKESFLLHYNFPQFAGGQVGKMSPPGRREIGHGALAYKALVDMVPSADVYPYTVRLLNDVLSSDGSSSMATVCASTLALKHADIPLKSLIGGVAMGMIYNAKNPPESCILTDLTNEEDYYGSMDFKLAGSHKGVTAIQMDIKIRALPLTLVEKIVHQARKGLNHILEYMQQALIAQPHLSTFTPKAHILQLEKTQVGMVIGSGGKTVKGICEETGAQIDIDGQNRAHIFAPTQEQLNKAIKIIEEIVQPLEVGMLRQGHVKEVLEFGVVLKVGGIEGLLHISEMTQHSAQSDDADILVGQGREKRKIPYSVGDIVEVYLSSLERGKIRFTLRNTNAKKPDRHVKLPV